MVDITEVSAVVAAAGVLVGVVYYILDMRNQSRIRKTDLVMKLYSTYTSKEFTDAEYDVMGMQFKDFEDFRKRCGPRLSEEHREIGKSISIVFGFYELVGTLLYRKLIELISVYDVFSPSNVKDTFEKMKPLIVGLRRERDDPMESIAFEYLYNEICRKEPQLKKTWEKAFFPTVSSSNRSTGPRGVKSG